MAAEHNIFFEDAAGRQAVTYLMDAVFDRDPPLTLQQAAKELIKQPFMEALPIAQRSITSFRAARIVLKAIEDIKFMELVY